MHASAQETYSQVLQEVQDFINQFAEATSTSALDVESKTVAQSS